MAFLLAVLAVAAGIALAGWSLTLPVTAAVHAAVLALVAFAFAILVGVWRIADAVDKLSERRQR